MSNFFTLIQLMNSFPEARLSLLKNLGLTSEVILEQEILKDGYGIHVKVVVTLTNDTTNLQIFIQKLRALAFPSNLSLDLNTQFLDFFNKNFDIIKVDIIHFNNYQSCIKLSNSIRTNVNISFSNFDCNTIEIDGIFNNCKIANGRSLIIKVNNNSRIESLHIMRLTRKGFSTITIGECTLDNLLIEKIEDWSLLVSNSFINDFSIDESKLFNLIIKNLTFDSKVKIIENKIDELIFEGLNFDIKSSPQLIIKRNEIKKIYFNSINFKERLNILKSNRQLKLDYRENITNSFITKDTKWSYGSLFSSNPESNTVLSSINELKSSFSHMKDTHTERIFEAFEKQWHFKTNKKNIPLAISWMSNEFGMSIVKPLIWILLFIVLEILFILYFSGKCRYTYIDNWGMLIQLLNPTHKTSSLIEITEGNCILSKSFINQFYVIDNLVRIVIGYLLFQFVSAFRYKYNLK